jgi:hypothetical protein
VFERFTDEARQAVERAQHEARALGHNYLGTEHLLVGLCLEDTAAGRALAVAGVTREAVLADVRRSVGEGRSPGPVRPDSESLASVGIDLDEVRRRAEQAFGTGALERTSAWRRQALSCITRRARKALHLALREALRLGHRQVGSEHVLLGLVRTEDGLAAEILARRAGSLAAVRSAVLHELLRPA